MALAQGHRLGVITMAMSIEPPLTLLVNVHLLVDFSRNVEAHTGRQPGQADNNIGGLGTRLRRVVISCERRKQLTRFPICTRRDAGSSAHREIAPWLQRMSISFVRSFAVRAQAPIAFRKKYADLFSTRSISQAARQF
jgi:hypothetical protein